MKKYKILALILALVMTLSLAACSKGDNGADNGAANNTTENNSTGNTSGDDSSASTDDPIVIGFLGWSSGVDAMYGLVPQFLMEHYFKEVNANGGWLGRQIDFRAYDISGLDGDFSEAVNAANKLIQSGVDIIMGPSNSTQGAAVAELCNAAGVLHIPSGSSQQVTVDDDGNVRPWTYRSGSVNRDKIGRAHV